MRILHLEDEEYTGTIINGELRARGHDVLAATCLNEARNLLSKGTIDWVICDGRVPAFYGGKVDSYGYDFAAELKERGIKVVQHTSDPRHVAKGVPVVYKGADISLEQTIDELIKALSG